MTKVYPKVSEKYALDIERARRKLRGLIAGKLSVTVRTPLDLGVVEVITFFQA